MSIHKTVFYNGSHVDRCRPQYLSTLTFTVLTYHIIESIVSVLTSGGAAGEGSAGEVTGTLPTARV